MARDTDRNRYKHTHLHWIYSSAQMGWKMPPTTDIHHPAPETRQFLPDGTFQIIRLLKYTYFFPLNTLLIIILRVISFELLSFIASENLFVFIFLRIAWLISKNNLLKINDVNKNWSSKKIGTLWSEWLIYDVYFIEYDEFE